jgi:glycosyltransferase involved in cell wall biosynthesis
VITPGEAWAMNRDDRLLGELPSDVQVIRTRSWEPRPRMVRSSARPAGATRTANHFKTHLGHLKRFPDAHVGWLPFAIAAARRVRFDVAYSSSGPFTSHLVGLALKRLTGRAWVAELRDGWYRWNRAIFPDYPAWRDVLERRVEAAALRSADRVVLVTERMADAFRCQYADLPPRHFAVVPNGFDPAQFPTAAERKPEYRRWTVVHAGALYYGRSLAAFLEAAARVASADVNFARQFRLTLIGTLDASAAAELSRCAIATHVQALGQLDHASTIAAMRAADALLLVANTTPGAEATVPGKLFEYLAVGRPVLAVAPPASSTADVLSRTGGGWLAPAGDPEAIASVLCQAFYDRFRKADPARVARFDRRVLAGDLARIFDQAVASAARRV